MKQVKIGSGLIEILQGDIASLDCDALINAANTHFWMGGGVAGALKQAGGPEIEKEAMAQGPTDPGKCVVTGPGKLKCKHIIHAAVMAQDLLTNETFIRQALTCSLEKAEELSLTSLAIPALGTGVGQFNIYEAATLHIELSIDFLLKSQHLKKIYFILADESIYDIFCNKLDSLFHR